MKTLMLASVLAAVTAGSAIAKGAKPGCVKIDGATYCAAGIDSPKARGSAVSVHSKGGEPKLVDDAASSCPKGVPPDGKLHVVPCGDESPSGWCRKKCVKN